MKLQFTGQFQQIPKMLMRKCGYHPFVDPNTRKLSYSRQLRPGMRYPRFHAYVSQTDDGFIVDLHLDQKHVSYKGSNKHAGEYDGPTVEAECRRVEYTILQYRMTI